MAGLRLLVLSDLHSDIIPMKPEVDGRRIDANADVVVLAGDIHEGVQAPMWARQAFPDKEIVLVAGNHEFYGRYWNRNLRKLREKSAALGIRFLENDAIELGGIRFLGCTLWTDFMLHGEPLRYAHMHEAQQRMTDYRRIKLDRTPGENGDFRHFRSTTLVPELTRRRHRESVAWLELQLQQGDAARTVVVTHHSPLPRSIPNRFAGHVLSPAYASDLSRLMGLSALWIHGHIHSSQDYMAGDTRVVANPRGYPGGREPDNSSFNPFFTVEI